MSRFTSFKFPYTALLTRMIGSTLAQRKSSDSARRPKPLSVSRTGMRKCAGRPVMKLSGCPTVLASMLLVRRSESWPTLMRLISSSL